MKLIPSIEAVIAQPPPWKGGKGDVLFGMIKYPATERTVPRRTSPLNPPSKGGGCALTTSIEEISSANG